ncbi:MAG: HD domain-containing protein [Actinobacteria bacterium]|nr:HD domain-containing protein [Actinomycetota bacterium]
MARVNVSDIKSGIKIISKFIINDKKLIPFKGKPGHFLTLIMADSTGRVEGKIWERAEDANGLINSGDLLEIKGSVIEYNGVLQVNIANFRVCPDSEFDPREFLPTSSRDTGEMLEEIRGMIDSIENFHLKSLLLSFFDDGEWVREFCAVPAAKANHQAHLGGLLEHTLNVARAAAAAAGLYPGLDRDLLLAGSILHDIGKIKEYSYSRNIDVTDQGRLLGHIVMGVSEVDRRISCLAGGEAFPEELRLKVLHIITSHHGLYEWQSPKKPKFTEAAVVHILDMLDSVVDTFTRTREENSDRSLSWSPWNRALERFVYLK